MYPGAHVNISLKNGERYWNFNGIASCSVGASSTLPGEAKLFSKMILQICTPPLPPAPSDPLK